MISLFAILSIMLGCKKKQEPIPIGMSFKYANTPWIATNYHAKIDSGATGLSLFIFSSDTTYSRSFDEFNISIYHYNKASVYYLTMPDTVSAFFLDYNIEYQAYRGAIIITQISATNVQGTFNCIMTGGLTISNGQFNIPIQ